MDRVAKVLMETVPGSHGLIFISFKYVCQLQSTHSFISIDLDVQQAIVKKIV